MQPLNSPRDYIEVAFRRKWWIIIPFVLVMMGSYAVYKKLPKIYKAATLILVQPQKIPSDYVRSTVTAPVSDRLPIIKQQILSRTSLEQVITQLHFIQDPSDPLSMSDKIKSMRKAIAIKVHHDTRQGTSAFTISCEDRDPSAAARIVNTIASLFIKENLRVREEQARGTSQFMEKELLEIERRLKKKEETLRSFKEKYMGELPAQLNANLRILERLQQQFATNNESLISTQQRKTTIEIQIDDIKNQMSPIRTVTLREQANQGVVGQDPLLTQLKNQSVNLEELQTRFTNQHPDVIAAKAMIEKLEAQLREKRELEAQMAKRTEESNQTGGKTSIVDPILSRLSVELQEVIDQIDRLEREQANLRDQIGLYQRRVENAPKREEQMSTLLRDYNLLQTHYQSMLDKKIQAQLAENLERKQKGEQFRILDPATPPVNPFKPNRKHFFGLAFILSLAFGGGMAYIKEYTDRSFHKVDDVERFLGFPVIATIPIIEKRKDGKKLSQPQVNRHFYKKEHNGKQISTT